jgi:hypothetical protein
VKRRCIEAVCFTVHCDEPTLNFLRIIVRESYYASKESRWSLKETSTSISILIWTDQFSMRKEVSGILMYSN